MPEITPKKADRIYIGSNIITVDDANSNVEAVAISGGTIVFVGSKAEAESQWKGDQTEIRTLEGEETLLPGFIDPHSHFSGVGLQRVMADLLYPPDGTCENLDQILDALRSWESKYPDSDWIYGFGYDDSLIGKHPTKEDLDKVSTTKPVVAVHQSFHIGSVNSKGLEILGFTDDFAPSDINPEYILKDKDGHLTGVLLETAINAANLKAQDGLKTSFEYVLGEAVSACLKYGFTTVQEGGAAKASQLGIEAVAKTGAIPLDVVIYGATAEALKYVKDDDPDASSYIQVSQTYKNHIRTAGVKMYLDGSPQGRTAWLSKPYTTPPDGKSPIYRGVSTFSDDQVYAQMKLAYKNGWQLLTHVNGDAAIDQYLISAAAMNDGKSIGDHRFVSVHSQITREDQMDTYKELGIIPSFFSMHTYYWGDWYKGTVLGNRYSNISPAQWALARGLKYTSHHDAPVAYPNSFAILYGQVARKSRTGQVIGPDQRVSMLDAIKSITINAAHQYFEEDSKGSITVGKLADLVILNKNPLKAESLKPLMGDFEVKETIKEGKVVYPESGIKTFSQASPEQLKAEKKVWSSTNWSCSC
jgi:predicted amidohydrolase YtcJ